MYEEDVCALYTGPILDQCFALYVGPILDNSLLYTLDQFCASYTGQILGQFFTLYIGPIVVLYILDQFFALYVGQILCFIHWTNSVLYKLNKSECAAYFNTRLP
jgi:hypothetical protein